jgi:hypothetical protein
MVKPIIKEDYSKFLFLDTETTGLDPGCTILEVGYILNGVSKDFLIKTKDSGSSEIHGITQKMSRNAKMTMIGMLDHLSNLDFEIIVGHKISFDVNLLMRDAKILNHTKFIDKMQTVRKYCTMHHSGPYLMQHYGQIAGRGLMPLYNFLCGDSDIVAHRTSGDNIMVKHIFDVINGYKIVNREIPIENDFITTIWQFFKKLLTKSTYF